MHANCLSKCLSYTTIVSQNKNYENMKTSEVDDNRSILARLQRSFDFAIAGEKSFSSQESKMGGIKRDIPFFRRVAACRVGECSQFISII